jgi:uncharacterized protein YlxW (UPF0749 family)
VTVRPVGVAGMLGLADNATVEVTYGVINPDLDVEERLKLLDARTREIQERVNRLQREARAETEARESADSTERTERADADEALHQRLADLAVGGLRLEAGGVAAFLTGTVLTTIPDELAHRDLVSGHLLCR